MSERTYSCSSEEFQVDDQEIFICAEVGIFNTPKIEVILISIVLSMRFYHLLELCIWSDAGEFRHEVTSGKL